MYLEQQNVLKNVSDEMHNWTIFQQIFLKCKQMWLSLIFFVSDSGEMI